MSPIELSWTAKNIHMKKLSLLTNMLKESRKGAKGARRLAKHRFPQAADRVGKRVQQVVVVFAVVLLLCCLIRC